jgi:hypothetical protein
MPETSQKLSLSVGTLRVDRCSEFDESLDQTQLAGDDAPMKGIIAKCVAPPRQDWIPPQYRGDPAPIPGDDRLFEHIEFGRLAEQFLHRPLEQ